MSDCQQSEEVLFIMKSRPTVSFGNTLNSYCIVIFISLLKYTCFSVKENLILNNKATRSHVFHISSIIKLLGSNNILSISVLFGVLHMTLTLVVPGLGFLF